MRRLGAALLTVLLGTASAEAQEAPWETRAEGAIRIAQFNAALSRRGPGVLLADIADREPEVLAVAEIVLRVRPDILLLNEMDRDAEGRALAAFQALLAEGVAGLPGLDYVAAFAGPSNTGLPSGRDLDGDGEAHGPDDAWGWGAFPGQYGMALLSRFRLAGDPRSYRLFPWAEMPGADRPLMPEGTPLHDDATWRALRLSSKSHWIVPVALPGGVLHVLAAHPTPPVFDGEADRNGRRNADEIRLLTAMLEGAEWLRDDAGRPGGLAPDAHAVVAGDLNADPADGEARRGAIRALLAHPRLQDPEPRSAGGPPAAARDGGANPAHATDPARDTADWRDDPGPGNLRVDYVLPTAGLAVTGAGVFWPAPGHPLARLAEASDHRLVWVDIAWPPASD